MATKKCAHEMCTCTVADGAKYCSTSCEDSIGVTTLGCDCGHMMCKGKEL
jgi:hypothetical protein